MTVKQTFSTIYREIEVDFYFRIDIWDRKLIWRWTLSRCNENQSERIRIRLKVERIDRTLGEEENYGYVLRAMGM